MSFKDRGWEARFAEMGDLAEGKFEDECARKGIGFVRCGLSRPPLAVHRLPHRVRYWPDYLLTKCFVEVQGFGRDGLIKMKLDKWGVLHWWRDLHPVELFFYDSHNDRHAQIGILDFDKLLCNSDAALEHFAEGKPYFQVPASHLFEDSDVTDN